MSAERSRPWQNPTPAPHLVPDWAGQFDTFDDWVRHATRALSVDNWEARAICVDNLGRRCHMGADFMRARDEGAFPVRYFWAMKPLDAAESAAA